MKKIFGLLLLAVTAFAVGCSRENAVPEEKPVLKMKVTMCADNSKTAMVPVPGEDNKFSPVWTAGDKLGVFVRANAAYVDQNIATEPLSENTASATFTASVTAPEEDATYEFYTYYPYNEIEGSNYDKVKVVIPAEQNPANSSFDPKADILSGYPIDVNVTAGQTTLDELNLQFIRKSSIVRFLIPSCSGFEGIDGNTPVSEVKVYFDQNVVGTATWDIRNSADLALDVEGASNLVTLKYTGTHKITDPLWLSIAPVSGVKSLTFAFKVADNAYLYASANLGSAGASFEAGGMKKYNIPISATKWELKSFQKKYVKVTSAPDSWYGKYLIVGANGEPAKLYACDQKSIGSWGSCSEVTAETDGSILGTADVNNYAFDVVSGTAAETYAFKFTSGDYSGQFVSSGTAKEFNAEETADSKKTDFTLNLDGENVTVKANTSETRQLRYNYNSGSGGLRFYDGTTANPVSLYKQVDDYSVIVPVIANPVGIPEEVAKEGVVDAQFTCDIANLGKNSVSIESVDGTVVTAASVSYNLGKATVTYTVAENTGADRNGWIVLKAGTTERQIDIHQATGIQLPVITDVDDQNITYEASTERSFDVTIDNVGSFEVSCTYDGTVVTAATPALKAGNVYTVTYTVTANSGMESRNGSVTINCSTVSSTVKIIQNYNVAAVKTYKRVASLSDIEPGRYVIVATTSSITAYLPNAKNTSSAPTAVTTGFTCTASEFKTLDDDAMAWDFTGTTSAMTINSAADAKNYLYNIANNNGTRVGTTSDTWTIAKHSSNEADNLFQFQDATNSRFTGIYNNAYWRSYATYNASNYTAATGSSKIKLYKYDDGKQDSDLAFSPATKSLGLDDEVTGMPTLSGHNYQSATYSSSATSVATVDDASGVVTLVGVGETTISATVPADAQYREGKASYTLTVTAPTRAFSVSPSSFSDVVAAGATDQQFVVSASDKVVWTIGNDEGLTIKSNTATVVDATHYSGSGTVTFDVAENTGVQRNMNITLTTEDAYVTSQSVVVTVSQVGGVVAKSFGVTESGTTVNISKAAYSATPIHITGDSDVAWTAVLTSGSSDDIAFDESGTGPKDMTVLIEENTGVARNFVITISTTDVLVPEQSRSHVVTIAQAGKATPTITVTPKSDLAVNTGYDVSEMFSSTSTGEFTYSIKGSPAGASLAADGKTFTATVAGTYTIVANQAATDSFVAASAEGDITVKSAGYTAITKIANLSAGDYLMGGNNNDLFTGSNSMYMWKGTINSSNKARFDTATCTFTNDDFNTTSGVATVTLVAHASISNAYYIKVGSNYLGNSGTSLSVSADNSAIYWTFQNDDKDGVVMVSSAGGIKVSVNSTGSTAIRAYASTGSFYKGIYFFKKK